MTPEQHDMEDLFRSAFENAALEPPHKEEMWDKIALALHKTPIPMYRTKWFKVSSIAASVALLLGAYFLNTSDLPSTENITNIAVQEYKIKKENQHPFPLKEESIVNSEKIKGNQSSAQASENTVLGIEAIKEQAFSKQVEEKAANTFKENTNTLYTDNYSFVEKQNNQALSIQIGKQTEKQEQNLVTLPTELKEYNFSLLRFEVKDLLLLIPQDLVSNSIIVQQPVVQLVVVEKPIIKEEKEKIASNYWIGFGGFYNTFAPNFGFASTNLPSPLISSNSGIAGINYGRATDVAEQLQNNLSVESTFSASLDFGKTISKYAFLRAGLGMTSSSYIVNARVTNRIGGESDRDGSLALSSSIVYHDNYIRNSTSILNIPIQVGLQTQSKGLNLFVAGGLSTDVTLNNSLSNTFRDASYNFGNYKAINFSALGSAGFIYNFTPHFSTLLEVNYRRSITSVYNSENLQSHPQWIGIGIGLRKTF